MTLDDFKVLRKYLDLTQNQLAQAMGVSRRAIAHWESGSRSIPQYVVILLGFLKERRDTEVIEQGQKSPKVVFPDATPSRSLADAAANPSKYP